MNTPEEHWWSVRAGEYVLGTLRGEDLWLFERILEHDTTVQAEVELWEKRLTGLNETIADKEPANHVWSTIQTRIRGGGVTATTSSDMMSSSATITALDTQKAASEKGAQTEYTATIAAPNARKSLLWPSIAAFATAASLIMGVLLLQTRIAPDTLPMTIDGLAVVLSDETGEPYFLVETDYDNLRVRVTALAPPSLDDDSDFQLWQAMPDRSSVKPVALLPETPGTTKVIAVDSLIEGSDLFGVSIEAMGAETTNGPLGPVVAHGDFVRNTDRD